MRKRLLKPQHFYLHPFACMDNSIATLHIKNYEGFGYLIIQSLAKGRPVFLMRSFADGRKLMNWCIEGETAFFFDSFEEFKEKIDHYLKDKTYYFHIQNNTAKQIRRIINNERQALIFEHFIQNLK